MDMENTGNAAGMEIVHCIKKAGLSPDTNDLTQLWQAVQSGQIPPGPDGTILSSQDGRLVWMPGKLYLDTPTTFWVRPDGNDNNNGSANTPEHAFKTITACARHVTQTYALTDNGAVIIKLGVPGTYVEPEGLRLPVMTTANLSAGSPLGAIGNRTPFRCRLEGDLEAKSQYIISVDDKGTYASLCSGWDLLGLSVCFPHNNLNGLFVPRATMSRFWNVDSLGAQNGLVIRGTVSLVGACHIQASVCAFQLFRAYAECDIGDGVGGPNAISVEGGNGIAPCISLGAHAFFYMPYEKITGTWNGPKFGLYGLSLLLSANRLETLPGNKPGVVYTGSVAG